MYVFSLFNTFLNNIKVKGLDDIVSPFRLSSTAAAQVLHCMKISADVVFIDADHDYAPVLRDIELFYPLVNKGGILIGHDYDPINWPGKFNPFSLKSRNAWGRLESFLEY